MKADIDENGKLSIIPETPIEQFALMHWWDDYFHEGSEKKNPYAVLEVCRLERDCDKT